MPRHTIRLEHDDEVEVILPDGRAVLVSLSRLEPEDKAQKIDIVFPTHLIMNCFNSLGEPAWSTKYGPHILNGTQIIATLPDPKAEPDTDWKPKHCYKKLNGSGTCVFCGKAVGIKGGYRFLEPGGIYPEALGIPIPCFLCYPCLDTAGSKAVSAMLAKKHSKETGTNSSLSIPPTAVWNPYQGLEEDEG